MKWRYSNIDWKDRVNDEVSKIPINYNFTMIENVKLISDWLKSYNQKYQTRYVVMYHAASKKSPILEQGLLAGNNKRKNYGMSESGYVYLAINPVLAKQFGDMTYNGDYSIYEVIVPIGKLLSDKKRLEITKLDGATDRGLAQSLVYAGSARIKGNIELWQIKLLDSENHDKVKPSLLAQLDEKTEEITITSANNKSIKKIIKEGDAI